MVNNIIFDWKKHIEECLNSTDYCSIATVDSENGVWNNPAYFAWDESYNFYFISMMKTRHMQNIKRDGRVSVAIYKTEQKGDVIGVQLEGDAKLLEAKEEIDLAGKVYYGRTGSLEQNGSFQHDPVWIFVKITPKNIFYFNSKIFGEERQEIPKAAWQ